MGLIQKIFGKSQPSSTSANDAGKAFSSELLSLPYAEPGVKCTGSHYFEDVISNLPSGRVQIGLVVDPYDNWSNVHVLWQGNRIGNVNSEQDKDFRNVLLGMAPAGTIFTATGETYEETSVDSTGTHVRKRVTALIPYPKRLHVWSKQETPDARLNVPLSEPEIHIVTLRGQGAVQDTLRTLVDEEGFFEGQATAKLGVEENGKYAGVPTLTFKVKGQVVGTLGGRFYEGERAVFEAFQRGVAKKLKVVIRKSQYRDGELYAKAHVSIPRRGEESNEKL
jgi:hypothetical protein